jgi:hypothetical protein
VATATWGRQTEALIQWSDNQFRFLEVPEKTLIFIFFSKNLPPLKSAALGGRLVRLMVKPPLTAAITFIYLSIVSMISKLLNVSIYLMS